MTWLSGSCSEAPRRELARAAADGTGPRRDPLALAADAGLAPRIAADAVVRIGARPVLVYATAPPAKVAAAGVGAFVVAGGATAGAVAKALGIRALAIGREIAPGVPWTRALGGAPLWLALKPGNFGGEDLFARASASR